MPIQFDNNHFCVINATVHSTLQDFKFRLSQLQVSQLQNENYHSGKQKLVLLQPKSFPEFLHKATNKFNSKDTESFFDCYVTLLRDQCLSLRDLLKKCLKNALPDIPIPKYSYQQYIEQQLTLTDTQYQTMKNKKLTDVIALDTIKNQHLLGNLIENDFN